MVAVARDIVERRIFDLNLFLCKPPSDVSGIYKLFSDSCKIVLGQGDVECGLDGFEVSDLIFRLPAQLGERLEGALLFIIFCYDAEWQ